MLRNTPKEKKELLQTLSYLEPKQKQKRQLLVDISGIKRYNSRTGIPRVVLNQLDALQNLDQDLFEVRAIYLSQHPSTLPLHFYDDTNKPISLQNTDIIYNPDLDPQSVKEANIYKLYKCYKNVGIFIVTLVHDILPITHPQFFVKGQDQIHKEWFFHVLHISDLLITTSKATKDAIDMYTKKHPKIVSIPLGTTKLAYTQKNISTKKCINFLVVSTIEPRKGHKQLLDAFEILWSEGLDFHLTIVGKQGWNIEELIKRFNMHPQKGKYFHYKDFLEDNELEELYKSSSALIAPSYAEGFGLPLIEAAQYKLPIIARNITVFNDIAKKNAFYFEDKDDGVSLANTIKEWVKLYRENSHPKSDSIVFYSWEQNAKKTLNILCEAFETTITK